LEEKVLEVNDVAFSPDGLVIALAATTASIRLYIASRPGVACGRLESGSFATAVSFSPDSHFLASSYRFDGVGNDRRGETWLDCLFV
jgi:WD40 repeat protein